MLRWKSKESLSSKGQKNFICREEKGKVACGHAADLWNYKLVVH
jgi:hypothetical protein